MPTRARGGKFKRWWKHMNSLPRQKRIQETEKWLRYAGKTVALRGQQDQQRIVYTIRKRFNASEFKRLSKYNAKKVFNIVNKKQQSYKEIKEHVLSELQRKQPVVVKKRTTRTIAAVGRQQ